MKEHFKAEEKAQVQRQIAAEKYQQELIDQVTAREEAKEFAYQQYLKGRLIIIIQFVEIFPLSFKQFNKFLYSWVLHLGIPKFFQIPTTYRTI